MSRPTGRRAIRACRVLLGVVVAGSLVQSGAAGAVDDIASLGGFNGSSAASGVHADYNAGGLLPLPPPVDLGSPDALATIVSGPSTFARASVLDPGDLLANPDALFALGSADYPAGTVPAYPFRVSATSGAGAPSAEVTPAPGLHARARVDDDGSAASASMPGTEAPGVATFGTSTSSATTRTDGSTVTLHARTQLNGFDLLGLLTIESVVTDLAAKTDGRTTEFSGGTKIAGAKLLGQPVTIDADGIHTDSGTQSVLGGLLGGATKGINEVLVAAGLRIRLFEPDQAGGGAQPGQRSSEGLRIEFEYSRRTFPALVALFDAVPPTDNPLPGAPSVEDLLVVAKARHLSSIQLGRGVVALAARPGFVPPEFPAPPVVDSGGGFATYPATAPPFVITPSAAVPTPPAVVPARTSETDELPAGAAVGSLVLLALLSLPFIGDRLALASQAILAGSSTDVCPLEEP